MSFNKPDKSGQKPEIGDIPDIPDVSEMSDIPNASELSKKVKQEMQDKQQEIREKMEQAIPEGQGFYHKHTSSDGVISNEVYFRREEEE